MLIILLTLAIVAAERPSTGGGVVTGGVQTVVVERGDTLLRLGARFGVDPRTIASDNGLSLDAPLQIGTRLTIDDRHVVPTITPGHAMVLNLPQRMLFVVSQGGVIAYPVAVGRRGWQTPLGEFSIVSKETDPTWDVPASIREEARLAGQWLPLKVPPGPNNPLGAYWLGLSFGSVGIHGTNAPDSIYRAVTHGCIRLHPDDMVALFGQVAVGTAGESVYEAVLLAIDGEAVFLEAHRDVYSRGPRDASEVVRARARELGVFDRIDWTAAEAVLQRREGVARVVTRR